MAARKKTAELAAPAETAEPAERRKPTDDMAEARADVKNAPDVTPGADDMLRQIEEAQPLDDETAAKGPESAAGERSASDPSEEKLDRAAASAVKRGVSGAYRRAMGEDLDDESGDMLAEWLSQALDLSRRFGFGPWPRFGLLTVVVGLVLAPPGFELYRTLTGKGKP